MKGIVTAWLLCCVPGILHADADALYKQGMDSYESNPQAAYALFIQAVGKGNVPAMVAAGYCCENGIGVEESWGVAWKWYRMAAAQDPVAACQGLSAICSLGRGVRLDDTAERVARFEKYGADPLSVREHALRLLDEGRQLDAEDLLDRALAVFPEDQYLAFMRGVLWRSRFTTGYSYLCFNAALLMDGDSIYGKAAGASINMDNGELVAEGFNLLRSLMHEYPDEMLFHWLFAIQCRAQEQFQHDGAESYATMLEQWQTGPVMVHHTYANILSEELRRNDEALKHRKIALQQAERSWTCQGMANTLYKLNRSAEAEPFYAKAAELDPDDSRHWEQWGACLVKLERFNEASDVLRKAAEVNPSDPDVRVSLAKCLVQAGEYREALNLFNEILEVNPDQLGALLGISLIYRDGLGVEKDENKAGEYDKRRRDGLNKLIQVKSSSGAPHSLKVEDLDKGFDFYREAQVHAYGRDGNERDNVKALGLFKKSYEVGDSFKGHAALSIGNVYVRGGHGVEKDSALALEWYAKAIEAGNNGAYGQLINFYLSPRNRALRDVDKALEYAHILEEKDPESASGLRWVAAAYAQAGQFDKAVQVQEKSIALYKKSRAPNERYIEHLEQILEKFRKGEKPYDY